MEDCFLPGCCAEAAQRCCQQHSQPKERQEHSSRHLGALGGFPELPCKRMGYQEITAWCNECFALCQLWVFWFFDLFIVLKKKHGNALLWKKYTSRLLSHDVYILLSSSIFLKNFLLEGWYASDKNLSLISQQSWQTTFFVVSSDTSEWQDMKYWFIKSRNVVFKYSKNSRRKCYLQDEISSLNSHRPIFLQQL